MTTVDVRSRFPIMLALVAVFAVLMLTSTAQAQSTAPAQSSITQTQSSTTQAPWWELIGGYEADTHGTGYAFFGPSYVHPFKPGVAWTANVFPNFLYYEFDQSTGTTKVR